MEKVKILIFEFWDCFESVSNYAYLVFCNYTELKEENYAAALEKLEIKDFVGEWALPEIEKNLENLLPGNCMNMGAEIYPKESIIGEDRRNTCLYVISGYKNESGEILISASEIGHSRTYYTGYQKVNEDSETAS